MRNHWANLVVAGVMLIAPAAARAQGRITPEVTNDFQMVDEQHALFAPADRLTGVSFIDSALPLTQVRTRIQGSYNNRQPTRAEYIWAKYGVLGGPGPFLPESRLDMQEFSTIVEYAMSERFSMFFETPAMWSNPEVNRNEGGIGNLNLGVKWAFWTNQKWATSVQLRVDIPTATERSLGNEHVSIEPSLMANWTLTDFLTLEGQIRYWWPVNGTEFAGDMLQYGIGLVLGQQSGREINVVPVVELIGWTMLDGQSLVQHVPGVFSVEDVAGQTILNVVAGARITFGNRGDIFLGYGQAITGRRWFERLWRFEMRIWF